jgi:hypothetical protein
LQHREEREQKSEGKECRPNAPPTPTQSGRQHGCARPHDTAEAAAAGALECPEQKGDERDE